MQSRERKGDIVLRRLTHTSCSITTGETERSGKQKPVTWHGTAMIEVQSRCDNVRYTVENGDVPEKTEIYGIKEATSVENERELDLK